MWQVFRCKIIHRTCLHHPMTRHVVAICGCSTSTDGDINFKWFFLDSLWIFTDSDLEKNKSLVHFPGIFLGLLMHLKFINLRSFRCNSKFNKQVNLIALRNLDPHSVMLALTSPDFKIRRNPVIGKKGIPVFVSPNLLIIRVFWGVVWGKTLI